MKRGVTVWKRIAFCILCALEAAAAVIYKTSAAHKLAARHNDEAVDGPILFFLVSLAGFFAVETISFLTKKKFVWIKRVGISFLILAVVLFFIGYSADCCTGG